MQEERLVGLCLLRLEKGRRGRDLIAMLHCLKSSNREHQDTLSVERTTENIHEQQDGKFQPDEEKNSSARLAEHGTGCSERLWKCHPDRYIHINWMRL